MQKHIPIGKTKRSALKAQVEIIEMECGLIFPTTRMLKYVS